MKIRLNENEKVVKMVKEEKWILSMSFGNE